MAAKIRLANERDAEELVRMMVALWPHADANELAAENAQRMCQPSLGSYFVAEAGDGTLVGFVETALRSVADGCATSPVGYVEAWYVKPHARRTGIGRQLITCAEEWSRQQGCSEMASDAEIENPLSVEVHRKLGFDEVSRVVTFRRSLRS